MVGRTLCPAVPESGMDVFATCAHCGGRWGFSGSPSVPPNKMQENITYREMLRERYAILSALGIRGFCRLN